MKPENTLVTLDTAKMLVDLGFDLDTDKKFYMYEKDVFFSHPTYGKDILIYKKGEAFSKSSTTDFDGEYPDYDFPCPTQTLASKWFRDYHDIRISTDGSHWLYKEGFFGYKYTLFIIRHGETFYDTKFIHSEGYYSIEEDAIEAALRAAGEILKKERLS